MNELKELVDFIEKTKFRSNSLLDAVIQPHSQMGKIYRSIATSQVKTDEEILAAFPDILGESALMTLKSRLKNRLCEMVFLLDFREEKNPDRQTAFIDCTTKWSSAMILISKNIRSVGIKQIENLLRHTQDFEFTELSMNIVRTLQLYYGTSNIDAKKYEKLDETYHELEATWHAERKAEKLYSDLMMQHVNVRSDKESSAEKAREYFQSIEPDMKRFPAFKVQFFGRMIEALMYDCRNDYTGMEKVCSEAMEFFAGKKYRSEMVQQAFCYNLITCCLYSRQFEKLEAYATHMLVLLEPNSFNWFRIQEILLIATLHTEQYDEALEILQTVQNNPHLAAQPPQINELWKIFEAYLWYLVSIQKVNISEAEKQQNKFRISRFVNDVPLLSKDKGGMNVSVLIIQFLFFVAQRKADECESRIDAMNKYCTRYLSDSNSLRSQYFFKMLIQIPQSDFNLKQIRLKTEKYYTQLLNTPWHVVNQHREVEVIPYENLWLLVLESLQSQPSASSSREPVPLYNGQRMSA
ncbi:MAG: hypothetical protein JNM22_08090 [Saprospiraceae bacterium]|nr:hypothetical protein [Saprospiraceae bacterium]